jgi:hypothetical protein
VVDARRLFGIVGLALAVSTLSAGRAEGQLGALLSPGPLAKAHAALEGIRNCQKCHEQGQKVTAEKCLTCHAPVAARIVRRVGVHKDVKGDCVTCHADHNGAEGELRPFDTAKFDHARVTGFPLTGKHAPMAGQCAACHKARSFLTSNPQCASCHTDVHKGSLGKDCAVCHSTRTAFTVLSGRFDHARTRFPLVGAHKTATCESCHVGNVFKGTEFGSCTSCHRDPHAQKFGAACTGCHTSDTWRTRRFDHSKTAFPLVARHTTVACEGCHKQPPMRAKLKADACRSCHVDVHRGNFKQDCKACHTEAGWVNTPFDHAQTRFPLSGKHQPLACEKCHTTMSRTSRNAANRVMDFRGLKPTCISCHADVHQGELGAACESCHSSTTFRLPAFRHARFPAFFAGQHAAAACSACHAPLPPVRPARTGTVLATVRFKAATTACVSCHQDPHLGEEGAMCETCHTVQTPKFSIPGFDHAARTSFPLTGGHEMVACMACHQTRTIAGASSGATVTRFKGAAKECRGCHEDVHLGQFASGCETCHGTTSFKLRAYKHRHLSTLTSFFAGRHLTAACAACHKPSSGRFPGGSGTAVLFAVDTSCVSCHTDIHRGSLGPNCLRCHRP